MNRKQGCELYGTEVMRKEEVEVMISSCLHNGATPEQAIEDVAIIDTLLHAKRLYTVIKNKVTYTPTGLIRKQQSLSKLYESIIEGAVNGQFK